MPQSLEAHARSWVAGLLVFGPGQAAPPPPLSLHVLPSSQGGGGDRGRAGVGRQPLLKGGLLSGQDLQAGVAPKSLGEARHSPAELG